MKNLNRRRMLAQSSGLLAGMGLPLVESMAGQKPPGAKDRLKVVVVGGHPDDPQSGCGGTMALYANQSHKVVALFLTRGEMGIRGKSPRETSSIRTAEAERSCEILGARPRFANQVDASTEVSKSRYEEFWRSSKMRSLMCFLLTGRSTPIGTIELPPYFPTTPGFAAAGVSLFTTMKWNSAPKRRLSSPTTTWISLQWKPENERPVLRMPARYKTGTHSMNKCIGSVVWNLAANPLRPSSDRYSLTAKGSH